MYMTEKRATYTAARSPQDIPCLRPLVAIRCLKKLTNCERLKAMHFIISRGILQTHC